MNLLAPLGLAALIALPLIVLLHMRHTTPTRRPTPSLRFWEAANPRPADARRLRRPPLTWPLVLQLLAAAVIAIALARPATAAQLAALAPGLHSEPRHLFILLDGSTSMSATTGDGTVSRWDAARQEAIAERDRKARRFWLGFGAVAALGVLAGLAVVAWLVWQALAALSLGVLATPVVILLVAVVGVGGHKCVTVVQHWH